MTSWRQTAARTLLVVITAAGAAVSAQAPQGAAATPPTPQASAAVDLTGNWVAVVTEDWRWRMMTPPKGDVASIPLNPEGIKVAGAWTPAQDGQCEAYGAAALMRMPTRLRISWQDPQTLKIETDAGEQTRLLQFAPNAPKPSARSLQGFTAAEWVRPGRGGGGFGGGGGGGGGAAAAPAAGAAPAAAPAPVRGSLKATTTMLRAGWLRKNGVPYSENAEVTEYFERYEVPNGDVWFVVTTVVRDPTYLNQEFVTSSHFKREADGSKWAPAPCRATP